MKPYRVDVFKSGIEDCKNLSVQLCFESENGCRYADIWIDKTWYFDKYKEAITVYLNGDNISEDGTMPVLRTENYKSAKRLVYAFLNVV